MEITSSDTLSCSIDNLRHHTNAGRQDKFFPNGTLRKALFEAGIDILG